jgi:Ca2+-binding RTX toxin-like protein
MADDNAIIYGYEIQHKLASEIWTSRESKEARDLLTSLGFKPEDRSNKLALLRDPGTRDALMRDAATKSILEKAGFGFNTQNSKSGPDRFHRGYNAFQIDTLNDIARNPGFEANAKKFAVLDFIRFIDKINIESDLPLHGTSKEAFLTKYNQFVAGVDYTALSGQRALDLRAFELTYDHTQIDPGKFNSELRYKITKGLRDGAGTSLTTEQISHADSLLSQAGANGSKSGHATAASIALIHDLAVNAGQPVSTQGMAEYLSARLYGLIADTRLGVELDTLIEKLTAIFDTIKRSADGFADSFRAFGESAIGSIGKSVNAMLVGLGGNAIGDVVEFLNMAYEPLKKGVKTGDWSDFQQTIVTYGVAAAVSAIIVVGSVVAATLVVGAVSASAAPIAAAFVGAGWAAYGLYDAVTNGAELIGKINKDLAEVIPKIGDTIERAAANAKAAIALMHEVIKGAFGKDFDVPDLKALIESKYLADTFDLTLPNSLFGGDRDERFYGKNAASIDGGAGDDEIYMINASGSAKGGAGNDILVGNAPVVVKSGELVNKEDREGKNQPNVPSELRGKVVKPVAETDLQLRLDGGEGNDWLVVGRGEGAKTIGGLGRDFIYNTSNGGEIYGDSETGTYEKPVIGPDGKPVLNADGTPKTTPTQVEDTEENADNIWYAPNTVVKDAQHHDVLKFYGLTLTGGNAEGGVAGLVAFGGMGGVIGMANWASSLDEKGKYDWTRSVYFDHLFPWMTYVLRPNKDGGGLDMYITNQFDQIFNAIFGGTPSEAYKKQQELDAKGILKGWMKIENADVVGSYIGARQGELAGQGDFNMVFKAVNPLADLLALLAPLLGGALGFGFGLMTMVDQALTLSAAVERLAKGNKWSSGTDPLVIDLDGDGIETRELATSQVYFDVDQDLFGERTGWLSGDDGFLTRDINRNGRIDDIAEMFGGPGRSGFGDLRALDSNHDGKITRADLLWAELKVWQDKNSDGVTDAGEVKTLDELGIVTLDLGATAIDITTPQGARLTAYGEATFANGTTRRVYDAQLNFNDTDTRYLGEAGRPAWQTGAGPDIKGFGLIANLAIAMANDPDFAALTQRVAGAMTTPDLRVLVAQAGEVLGAWGESLERTRELTPVLVGTDASGAVRLLDRGVYVEDAQGGYWTLASGAPVRDARGQAIARASLQQVLAQAASQGATIQGATIQGATWRLEQFWSPSSREAALTKREPAPYLARLVNGRAVIVDYGVKQADGSWRLASGGPTYMSAAALMATTAPAGTEWRLEELGFNPYAHLSVDRIGVRFTDGVAIDYTVQVTDRDGSFYVWARNLDRALQLEWKTGDNREFNLRNYAVNFDRLDEVNSTDNSTFRVEMLTPAQFHFATSLGGIDFRPEILTAQLNSATGHLSYFVGPGVGANLSADPRQYISGIDSIIAMLQPVMEQYISASRRYAVRLAMQGGLKSFFGQVSYDVASDSYKPTTNRELAPLFEAIFRGAPASNKDDAVLDYLTDWNAILWQIYPDYRPSGEGNLGGSTLSIDQAFILQMLLPAFETIGVDLDIRGVAHALSVSEERIVTHAADAAVVTGTDGVDYFYMTAGAQTLRGGRGADVYFVGRNAGNDTIDDKDLGEADQLRFTDLLSSDVKAERIGQDLILTGAGRTLRLIDQFLGELNDRLISGKQIDSGVSSIVFADGVAWDRFRMSMEVLDKARAAGLFDDNLTGSGSADIIWGGKGNDYLSGGAGGDIYIFAPGDGQDVINDLGTFSFGPVKAGIDLLRFKGGITADRLKLIRDGESADLRIVILDDKGVATGDTIKIEGAFGGIRLGIGVFADLLGGSDGLDYVAPNLIERFIFDDGSSLDFGQVMEKVLLNAKTDGNDAIYGFLNNNTLDGGAGNDFLSGKEGDDTYRFGRGYGRDIILDNGVPGLFDPPQNDRLVFGDQIRWTDLDFIRGDDGEANATASDTFRMRIKGASDEVILRDFLETIPFFDLKRNFIESIVFGDGTTWSGYKLAQYYLDIAKTGGNDTIYGYEELSDLLDGGAGNDSLIGLDGNDVYQVARGAGNDTILDSAGDDRLDLTGIASRDVVFSRGALDLIVTVRASGQKIVLQNQYIRDGGQTYAVEAIAFSDRTLSFLDLNPEDIDLVGGAGADTLAGSNFAERIDGRGGNDSLIGGDGGDTYVFDAGYGSDVMIDKRVRASWDDRPGVNVPVDDIVEFGAGITRSNVIFTKDGNDLLISITGRSDTLRIRDQFLNAENGVERFRFFNGTSIGIADVEDLLRIAAGNRGDNVVRGALNQANALDGGKGSDTLFGGNLADSYAFTAGYGLDRIVERQDAPGILDRVIFGASVRLEDIRFIRNNNDLIIDLGSGTDVLTIVNGLSTQKIEELHFSDGRVMSIDDILDRLLTGGAGDDRLVGFDNRDDTLSGGAGTDALEGGLGNDLYRFGIGDGRDNIFDKGGIDTVVFGAGITLDNVSFRNVEGNLLISVGADQLAILSGYHAQPVESFVFADGTTLSITQVRGLIRDGLPNAGQDRIDLAGLPTDGAARPGTGHDRLILAQDSRVVIGAGEGIDSVEMPAGVTQATVAFESYASKDAVVRLASLTSPDLIIAFASGSQLVVKNALNATYLPNIEFADGVTLDAAALTQAAMASQASAGADVILGGGRADTITGGLGDDAVNGGAGDDLYRFARGDGRDVIIDPAGMDILDITGYSLEDLRVLRVGASGTTLLLSFADSADQITLRYTSDWRGVDRVRFSDGRSLGLDQLRALAAGQGSWQDDRVQGSAEAETLAGGRGDDVLVGGGGADIFLFSRGDGQDRIAGNRQSTLVFGAGIALEDIVTTRDRAGNLELSIRGSDDRVTLIGSADGSSFVGTVRFADGRALAVKALAASILAGDLDERVAAPADAGTSSAGSEIFGAGGNDSLAGGPGADVITGGLGDDVLEGGGGGDTFVFARGDGQDVVSDAASAAGDVDTIRFAAGIRPGDIRFLSIGPQDLVIGLAGGGDRLTLRNFFAGSGIERFAFADGTSWGQADIVARAAASAGAGDDRIDLGARLAVATTLDGKAGDDWLAGGIGNTSYIFGRGYGRDTISEGDWTSSSDTLRLASGIAPTDVVVILDGDNLVLRFKGGDDRLTLLGQAAGGSARINTVIFADRTQWSAAALRARALSPQDAERVLHPGNPAADPFADPIFGGTASAGAPTVQALSLASAATLSTQAALAGVTLLAQAAAVDPRVIGTSAAETLTGGAGADTLIGAGGADTLIGGDGDDQLSGDTALTVNGVYLSDLSVTGAGNALEGVSYTDYDPGAPPDYINGEVFSPGQNFPGFDRYMFLHPYQINPAAYVTFAIGDATRFTTNFAVATGRSDGVGFRVYVDDRLIFNSAENWRSADGIGSTGSLNIAGGTTLKLAVTPGTSGDYAWDWGWWLNPLLSGGTRYSAPASGADSLDSGAGADTLFGGVGNDTLSGGAGDDSLAGGSDDDRLDGGAGADTLVGGAGNDTLVGSWGDDVYIWSRGDGDDVVDESSGAYGGWSDKLILNGVSASQVSFVRDGQNVTLVIAPSAPGGRDGGNVNLMNIDLYNDRGVETIVFADARWLTADIETIALVSTTWSIADLRAKAVALGITSGADSITGFGGNDSVHAGSGNDSVMSLGGSDTLVGGVGNDTLVGSWGDDVYIWSRGDGDDVVDESSGAYGGWSDKLILNGVSASQVSLVRDGQNVTLVIAPSAPGGRDGGNVNLMNIDLYNDRGVETIVFADATWLTADIETIALVSTTWSIADLRAKAVALGITSSADSITGFGGNDSVHAGSGNDSVMSLGGSDTLVGGVGNDTLVGSWGDDVYIWSRGDGDDVVDESSGAYGGWSDKLILNGVSASQVSLVRDGQNVTLVIAPSAPGGRDGGNVNLMNIDLYNDRGVETIVFADATWLTADIETIALVSTTWSIADLRAKAVALGITSGADSITGFNGNDSVHAGSGNDSLTGFGGNDTLIGGAGNDTLVGGGGDDVYIWNRGDGDDVVDESSGAYGGWSDKLILNGVSASQVSLVRDGQNVTLVIAPSAPGGRDGGNVNLMNIDLYNDRGVETIIFADATWSMDYIRALFDTKGALGNDTLNGQTGNDSVNGRAGDDRISTFDGNDNIIGGAGADTLIGGTGDDVYFWSRGDGDDLIDEVANTGGGTDRLVLHGITAAQVSLVRAGQDVSVVIASSAPGADDGGRIKLSNFISGDSLSIDSIVLADAFWSTIYIKDLLDPKSSSGTDSLTGSGNEDLINGLAGDDSVTSFGGRDTLIGGGGDDTLAGGKGDDVYIWNRGDGDDVIDEWVYESGTDRLILNGVTASQVSLARDGQTVTLMIAPSRAGAGDGGSVDLGTIDTWGDSFVESVVLSDTTWSIADMRVKLVALGATSGDDSIAGFGSNDSVNAGSGDDSVTSFGGRDTLIGGGGDDTLAGGKGDDVYIWNRGDGDDVIDEWVYESGTDRLILNGVTASQVSLARDGQTVTLMIAPSRAGAGDGAASIWGLSIRGETSSSRASCFRIRPGRSPICGRGWWRLARHPAPTASRALAAMIPSMPGAATTASRASAAGTR